MISLFEAYLKLTDYNINYANNKLKQIQSLQPEEIKKLKCEKMVNSEMPLWK